MSETIAATTPGAELLCETCGYELQGLEGDGVCPECGTPIADSSPALRIATKWEEPGNRIWAFFATTTAAIFTPKRFYRRLRTRMDRRRSSLFSHLHMAIASLLIGWGVSVHGASYYLLLAPNSALRRLLEHPVASVCFMAIATFVSFELTVAIAARLTSLEARFWGYRLPLHVVRRGMDYHAAHYLPVALVGWFTMLGYPWLLRERWVSGASDLTYLYILCGEVIAAAGYLFWTYWISMKNMMYANA